MKLISKCRILKKAGGKSFSLKMSTGAIILRIADFIIDVVLISLVHSSIFELTENYVTSFLITFGLWLVHSLIREFIKTNIKVTFCQE